MKVAGIVLYNPSINRLKENLDSIAKQVDVVILVDNGSTNFEDIKKLCEIYQNVETVCNGENLGVAKALNQIVLLAEQKGAQWVLTLDQDSVCSEHLIEEYNRYTDLNDIASMTCEIMDRNFKYDNTPDSGEPFTEIKSCITSGNYIKISAWKEIDGFDEILFIDKVDTDYCFRLVQNGYQIIKIPYQGLLHEVGENTRTHKLFGKKFTVFNHSPFRCYYIVRNQIYFSRKHQAVLGKKMSARYKRTAWTRIFVYLFFENKRFSKLKAWFKGIRDGYKISIK